ncbi:ASCH domain-containing protein [Ferrovibrio xuzhouensis]|uniref:ASCH domain-containing protein n=1 Tax=Ferrovibrio xuzhouensis TaxID=1576914 RepID=A0ABV7VCN6_9PROT
MKALSIRAPWWWFILHGGKDIENRSWRTNFRGTVLVHAAKTIVKSNLRDDLACAGAIMKASGHSQTEIPRWRDFLDPQYRGALVGTVGITDCLSASTSPWFFGSRGFVLRNPTPFRNQSGGCPIPFKGAQGFFDVPDDLIRNAVPMDKIA